MSVCGTRRAYELGCRCEPCRTANLLYKRQWRRRKGIPIGRVRGSRPPPQAAAS